MAKKTSSNINNAPENTKPPLRNPAGPSVSNPGMTAEMLDIVFSQTIGLAMHNAVFAQQNAQILNAAIVSATCTRILAAGGLKAEVHSMSTGQQHTDEIENNRKHKPAPENTHSKS